MNIPEKAIICTPTAEDAVKLDRFLREHTGRWVPPNDWNVYKEETCWDLCEEDDDHRLIYMSRHDYEEAIYEYDNDEDYHRYVPEDPSWRFVSVDEFIARCLGCECPDDDDIEVGNLL